MIVIYGANWCKWCKEAKSLAESRDLPYVWKNVENLEVFDEMKSKVPEGTTKIPQIFWHDRHVGGYDAFMSEIENTAGGFGDGKI
jgi:glutaredoxin